MEPNEEMPQALPLPPDSIGYTGELATLVRLIKSNTSEGEQVIQTLKSGDESEIRRMLQNFGNPQDQFWAGITSASPWANWQIDQAISDLNLIKPPQPFRETGGQGDKEVRPRSLQASEEFGAAQEAAGFWYW